MNNQESTKLSCIEQAISEIMSRRAKSVLPRVDVTYKTLPCGVKMKLIK